VDLSIYWPALLAAFLITLLEMTEVVILVITVSADHPSVRPGATGAVVGVAGVSLVAVGVGAALDVVSHTYLLWVSAVLLAGFGVVLFRSTLKSYRRAAMPPGMTPPSQFGGTLLFGAGATSGAVEATEVVVVLLGITAAGYAFSAIVGALAGGALLIVLAFLVHERLRRIKVPALKWVGTAMLFTFATFWFGEAAGFPWPGSDLFLVPLYFAALLLVRAGVQLRVGTPRPRPSP
jgi:uncharacterized membrane protein